MTVIATIGGVRVEQIAPDVLHYLAGLAVDADGAPNAYHPRGEGLDRLANGRASLVRGRDGQPLIQGPDDPAPGYYVSATSLRRRDLPATDPRAYVDAKTVPYLALPSSLVSTARDPDNPVYVGDLAWVRCGARESWAIVADVGPRGAIGEGSIALARALGIPADPRAGGCSGGVEVWMFLGSRTSQRWPRADVEAAARALAVRAGIPEKAALR